MGEGPKDVRDDVGRFDAPRQDDMVGRGESDIVGRRVPDKEPLTPASGAYPPAAPPAGSGFGESAGRTASRACLECA